jgi:putative addiction module component (TIGR02574 family)
MSADFEKIYNEALSLPADARMSLIERLLSSLHLPTPADIDRLWAEEAERRVSEIENGEVELVSGEEVFAKILEKYRR